MRRIIPFLALLALALPCGASAQLMRPSSSAAIVPLYVNGTLAGNAADLTEDQMMAFTVPGGTLVNVGDTVHIITSGTSGGTTDTKTVRVRLMTLAGATVGQSAQTTASNVRWTLETWITKTDTGSGHTWASWSSNGNGATAGNGTTALTDSAAMPILISGQNATSSIAGSVACQYFRVDLIRAPGS